jgi:ferredoxin
VYISECTKGGNGAKCGLYPGLMLIEACGRDVKEEGFDEIMDIFRNNPENKLLNLTFISINDILRGSANLEVKQSKGNVITVSCMKGQILRDALLGANIDVYDLKGKVSNCGGGGQCGTCVVRLNVDKNDWEPKPDFETKRLKKYDSNCRLSCNVVIEGDASIELRPSVGNDA